MDKSINPYDLGQNSLVEQAEVIKIQDIIRQAQKGLKLALIGSQIEALGIKVEFSTSRTRFGGERLWFTCPMCHKRSGRLYRGQGEARLGCRECLGLIYSSQRYKTSIRLKL